MSLESASNARLDRQSGRERTARRVEQLYVNARKLLEQSRYRMQDFTDLYGPQQVMADFQRVKGFMAKNQFNYDRMPSQVASNIEQSKKLSTICEAAFLRGIKQERWLGEDAYVSATSPFDDWVNDVDLGVEFSKESGSSYLGLAIDVTFAGHLDQKFDDIKRSIDRGELSKIKYFKSHDGRVRGELSMVPRVVVGVDSRRMEQILNRWNDDTRNPLSEPLVHDGFLEEIRMQLAAFKDYAERKGQKDAANAYARDLMAIEQVIAKQPITSSREDLRQDRVFAAIEQNLERFKGAVEK
jgi:hypothetical protein